MYRKAFARLPLWLSVFVTVTATLPAAPAGVVAVIELPLTNATFVAGTLPKVTVAPGAKFAPPIVTAVPPTVGPLFGYRPLTVGRPYVNPPDKVPLWPSVFVTVTATLPTVPAGVVAGVVAVIEVGPTTTTFVAATLPNFTVAPVTKFAPVIVTAIPPAVAPLFGVTLLTAGGGVYIKPFVRVPLWPLGFVTVTLTLPATPEGVVAVMDVALTTVTFVAAVVPNVTVAPTVKFVPVIDTAVPPAIRPLLGEIPVTFGPDKMDQVAELGVHTARSVLWSPS
jgi:hypothetical protein